MRVVAWTLAAVLGLAWAIPDDAAAAEGRGARVKRVKQVTRAQARPASVGPNGLCQRDTGTPTSQLDFRNPCDTEEFWRRTMEKGVGADR